MDQHPNVKNLEKSGAKVSSSKEKVRQIFEQIYGMNKNNAHLHLVYGKFLIKVTNDEEQNINHLEKAEDILRNARSITKWNDLSNKYDLSARTAYMAVSGDEDKPGTIVHTNNLAKEYFGYARQEVLGHNVKIIMPKIFA